MIDLSQHGYSHDAVVALLQRAHAADAVRYAVDVTRAGVVVMQAAYTACRLECDSTAAVKHFGSITLEEDPRIDWETDRLRPVLSFEQGGLLFSCPFVPLVPVTVAQLTGSGGEVLRKVEMYDASIGLHENSLGYLPYFPTGMLYTTAVAQMLERAGFSQFDIPHSDRVFSCDREDWEEDNFILDVANALLEEIGYTSLTADERGNICTQPYIEPSATDAAITYTADADSILYPEKESEFDGYRRANRFVGTAFSPDMEGPLRFEYINTDPTLPTSTVRQGRVITEHLSYSSVADAAVLEALVLRRAFEVVKTFERSRLTTAILPMHGVGDVVRVNAANAVGTFEEYGWSIDHFGSGGKMLHKLQRLVVG